MTGTLSGMTHPLEFLIGDWVTEMSHPALPGVEVHGRATGEWGPNQRFIVLRSETDHPDFPDSVSILGAFDDDPLQMHYFDSRGVHRVYETSAAGDVWHIERDFPGFSQKWDGRISADRNTIAGVHQASRDGTTWEDDLDITYRRA